MTYTRSTGRHREPSGQNVFCCIDVAVVNRAALRARPRANVQRQPFDDETARVACFAAREESIDLHELPAVPLGFVFELPEEFRPTGIRDHTRERVVLNHPRYVQILDYDHLVFANESSAQFVEMVLATVGHVSVKTRQLPLRFIQGRPVTLQQFELETTKMTDTRKLTFSQPGETVAHIERRPSGALLLIIPMTMVEAAALLDAANGGILSGAVDGDNVHLSWILGRITTQINFASAELVDAKPVHNVVADVISRSGMGQLLDEAEARAAKRQVKP